ncbi:hypothetical protein QQF64_001412 [Cirrhinus molitorella]|uniref:Uncharacterized protein n=1 Tax=Cirrhinus molitorella TaxID=172907 RepID=A0ABR3P0A6_9TELE
MWPRPFSLHTLRKRLPSRPSATHSTPHETALFTTHIHTYAQTEAHVPFWFRKCMNIHKRDLIVTRLHGVCEEATESYF